MKESTKWELFAISAGLGSIIGLASTIWKIYTVKTIISTDPVWMWALVYVMGGWLLYGIKIKSFSLWFTNLICLIEVFVIIYLYYRYR